MQCVMVTVTTDSSRAQRVGLMRMVTFILGAAAGANKMTTVSGMYSHRVLWRVTGSLCPFLPPDGLLFPLARIRLVDRNSFAQSTLRRPRGFEESQAACVSKGAHSLT